MMDQFIKREISFVTLLILFSLLLFGIHWYLDFHFFEGVEYTIPIFSIYIFHIITVTIVFTLINYIVSKGKKEYFILFLGATLVKMILCIVFLLPVLLQPDENSKHEVFNFFIPYFLYLAFELITITQFFKEK
jgi:hypothetical protein